MYQEKIFIIFNPTADHGKAVKRIALVEAEMDRAGVSYEMVLTRGSGHAVELAREAALESLRARQEGREGYRVIAAAGGDGTVNEVLNGLMRVGEFSEPAAPGGKGQEELPDFGVLPVGRGNDFAYGAGIPHDLQAACRMLVEDHVYTMDMGKITGGYYPEGRYFGNGIGVGFDTLVGLEAAKVSWIPGFLGYVYGALKIFFVYPQGPQVRISRTETKEERTAGEKSTGETGAGESETRLVIESRSQQISIMNGRRMGGTFFMAPNSIINDGELDLCMTREQLTRKELFKALGQYTRGSQVHNPHILTDRAAGYRISAPEGGLVCHADGETICINGNELIVECIPKALRIRAVVRES